MIPRLTNIKADRTCGYGSAWVLPPSYPSIVLESECNPSLRNLADRLYRALLKMGGTGYPELFFPADIFIHKFRDGKQAVTLYGKVSKGSWTECDESWKVFHVLGKFQPEINNGNIRYFMKGDTRWVYFKPEKGLGD